MIEICKCGMALDFINYRHAEIKGEVFDGCRSCFSKFVNKFKPPDKLDYYQKRYMRHMGTMIFSGKGSNYGSAFHCPVGVGCWM